MSEDHLGGGVADEQALDAAAPQPPRGRRVVTGEHGERLALLDPLVDGPKRDARVFLFLVHGPIIASRADEQAAASITWPAQRRSALRVKLCQSVSAICYCFNYI